MLSDRDYASRLLRLHIIASQLTIAEMQNASTFYTLEGFEAKLVYRVGLGENFLYTVVPVI